MGQEIAQAFARSIWDYNNLQKTLGNLIKRKADRKKNNPPQTLPISCLNVTNLINQKLHIDSNTYMHILTTNLDTLCSYFPPTTSM